MRYRKWVQFPMSPWTHNTVDCRIKRAAERRSQNAKELNALVQAEVRKALSKAKSSKKSSGDSSGSESSTGSVEWCELLALSGTSHGGVYPGSVTTTTMGTTKTSTGKSKKNVHTTRYW